MQISWAKLGLRRGIKLCLIILGGLCIAKGTYIPAKAALAQILMERAWVKTQTTGQAALPWRWMDARPAARLYLPNKDSHIVLDRDSGQALAFGPALMSNPDMPSGALIAIAAHKNTQFQSLKSIKAGEVIGLETPQSAITHYRVTDFEILDSRIDKLPIKGAGRLALVTCYPFDAVRFNGPLRYVVYAEKIT